jgi:hypothetical protein
MVVRNTTGEGCMHAMLGTPIEVTDRGVPDSPEGPWWNFKGSPLLCPTCKNMEFFGFLDADLQRLRGPGIPGEEVGADDALRIPVGVPA